MVQGDDVEGGNKRFLLMSSSNAKNSQSEVNCSFDYHILSPVKVTGIRLMVPVKNDL